MHASDSSLEDDLTGRIVRFFFLNEVKGTKVDAEKIQRFDGERNSGNRYRRGRRRRADLRGVRGCAAGRISVDGTDVRRNARRGGGAPRPADRDVPPALRGTHSADPAGKRERIPAKKTRVAGAAAGREGGKEASRSDGAGGAAFLSQSCQPYGGRVHAGIAESACGRREEAHTDGRRTGRKTSDRERERSRRSFA